MKTRQNFSLYRVISVFVAGLFLFVLTACGGPNSKVLANDSSSTRPNKPARVDVVQPNDVQQRQDTSEVNAKAEKLIEGSKRNLERHGNYQGTNNPLNAEGSLSDRAEDVKNKAGEGIQSLKENLQNTAQDAQEAAASAARTAKNAADDVSNKAQRTGNQLRIRTYGDD